jgi:antitoxin ChpS
MHITHLRKVGGSVMLAIPPALVEILHLQARAKVRLTVENGRLIVEPGERPRYRLEQLLKECNPEAPRSKADLEWLKGRRAGRELI